MFHHEYGLDVVALRYFTAYGPRCRPEVAMHKFAHLMVNGVPIPVFGEGRMERDFTYIDDIVAGTRSAIAYVTSRSPAFEIFNLAGGRVVTLDHMIATLEDALGVPATRKLLPMQPGDIRRASGDIAKAGEHLGYDPQVAIETGIGRFVAWYRDAILTLPPERRAAVLAR